MTFATDYAAQQVELHFLKNVLVGKTNALLDINTISMSDSLRTIIDAIPAPNYDDTETVPVILTYEYVLSLNGSHSQMPEPPAFSRYFRVTAYSPFLQASGATLRVTTVDGYYQKIADNNYTMVTSSFHANGNPMLTFPREEAASWTISNHGETFTKNFAFDLTYYSSVNNVDGMASGGMGAITGTITVQVPKRILLGDTVVDDIYDPDNQNYRGFIATDPQDSGDKFRRVLTYKTPSATPEAVSLAWEFTNSDFAATDYIYPTKIPSGDMIFSNESLTLSNGDAINFTFASDLPNQLKTAWLDLKCTCKVQGLADDPMRFSMIEYRNYMSVERLWVCDIKTSNTPNKLKPNSVHKFTIEIINDGGQSGTAYPLTHPNMACTFDPDISTSTVNDIYILDENDTKVSDRYPTTNIAGAVSVDAIGTIPPGETRTFQAIVNVNSLDTSAIDRYYLFAVEFYANYIRDEDPDEVENFDYYKLHEFAKITQ